MRHHPEFVQQAGEVKLLALPCNNFAILLRLLSKTQPSMSKFKAGAELLQSSSVTDAVKRKLPKKTAQFLHLHQILRPSCVDRSS